MKIITIVLLIMFSSLSNASLIKFSFEATGFTDCCNNQINPPQETVIGHFIWEAENELSSIINLLEIELTIDGYQYSLSDVNYYSSIGDSFRMVGGIEDNGAGCGIGCVLLDSQNDFRLSWDILDPLDISFAYTGGQNDNGVWISNSVNTNVSSVPEPSTLLLLLPSVLLLRRRG